MVINAIWDDVIIMPYNFEGVNPSFPAVATVPNYPRGTVNYIGPNVDRVSVGQLVIFKQGPYVYDGTNTWAIVSQEAILVTLTTVP